MAPGSQQPPQARGQVLDALGSIRAHLASTELLPPDSPGWCQPLALARSIPRLRHRGHPEPAVLFGAPKLLCGASPGPPMSRLALAQSSTPGARGSSPASPGGGSRSSAPQLCVSTSAPSLPIPGPCPTSWHPATARGMRASSEGCKEPEHHQGCPAGTLLKEVARPTGRGTKMMLGHPTKHHGHLVLAASCCLVPDPGWHREIREAPRSRKINTSLIKPVHICRGLQLDL